jgi:hypothetical protein
MSREQKKVPLMTEDDIEAIRDRYVKTLTPLFLPEDPISHDIVRYVKFRRTQYPHHKKPAPSRKIRYNILHAKHLPQYQLQLCSGDG